MEESSKQGQTKEAKQHRKKQARYIYMHIAHVQTHTHTQSNKPQHNKSSRVVVDNHIQIRDIHAPPTLVYTCYPGL